MSKYQELKAKYTQEHTGLNKRYKWISVIRLIVFLLFLLLTFKSFNTFHPLFIAGVLIALLAFIILMRIHKRLSRKKLVKEKLIEINEEEIDFLKGDKIPFQNGKEYIDFDHFYTFDLDFFGENSLFHHLNRTATYPGSKRLSSLLQSLLSNDEILENQEAIKELKDRVVWRQQLLAFAKITNDNSADYKKLIKWSNGAQEGIPTFLIALFYIGPMLFLLSFIINFFRADLLFFHIATGFFIFNLFLAGTQTKRIKKELINSDHITTIVGQYGLIIEKIENEKFESAKLNELKEQLSSSTVLASAKIRQLYTLFSNVESIQNGFAAILFNGSFLYHIHNLNALIKWRKSHAGDIKKWISVIADFEALNSLANFSYNNSGFTFPALNQDLEITFTNLGHPLINEEQRVCNDIQFEKDRFIILTGSNMSGKSTFLRTLGINMVLAGIGAPICASAATLHPLHVIVSMRQKDSLNDGESYFFAEVKRLKKIMDKLDEEICFVLLDEILKGTNSDDKQTGTIEVIKKVISKNAIGCIATHDLDVCKTTADYPDKLRNQCFEVEIIDDELSFDYKLKNGVCKNKSATFIMKKTQII